MKRTLLTLVSLFVILCGWARAESLAAESDILIVPLQSPPLRVPMNVYGAWFGLAGIALDASRATRESAATSQEATSTLNRTETWQPTVVIAKYANFRLERRANFNSAVVPDVAPVPGLESDAYTFFGENWMRPIRRWQKEKVSSVEYLDAWPTENGYVLEIAISNYELTGSRLILAITAKIVSLPSREVLGSTRQWKQFHTVDFDELFENDAAAFKQLFSDSSQVLVDKALIKLGLM